MNRKFTWILLSGILVFLSSGCLLFGPVKLDNGQTVPYEVWLATSEARDNVGAVQERIGTFTPTWTPVPPTATQTPTATLTHTTTATITPSPTPKPYIGYWVVNNREGNIIATAEFKPACEGEYGIPGIDVWEVKDGVPIQMVCNTPWNRPANMAIDVVKKILVGLGIFVGFLMLSNEIRVAMKKRRRRLQYAQQIPSPVLPASTSRPRSEVDQFLHLLGTDIVTWGKVIDIRKNNRPAFAGVKTISGFAKVVGELDPLLFSQIQTILEER